MNIPSGIATQQRTTKPHSDGMFTMTSFPNSPKPLKGGIVLIDLGTPLLSKSLDF
jgi:hypothetical protein